MSTPTTRTLLLALLALLLLVAAPQRAAASVAAATAAGAAATPADRRAQFEAFKAAFGRRYASAAEEAARFAVFSDNMATADAHARANPLATFGVNNFSDVSAAEFKVYHSAEAVFQRDAARRRDPANPHRLAKEAIPPLRAATVIDWREKGAVTAVKNQGLKCGSCYAFSTTGNIEGQWAIAGNPLTSLSEQMLVSCDTIDGGCGGGLPDDAFTWIVQSNAGNIVTEASYPYVSADGTVPSCALGSQPVGATIAGHHDIPQDEASMAAYMAAHGPISIGVDATSFQTYSGGVLTNCVSRQADHAVLIVGANLAHSPPYWIIKNSWGASWGEAGYIRVAYGSDQCVITTAPSSSIVAGGPGPQPPSPPSPSTPPSPPTPPTPPTPPAGGNYTYQVCSDSACSASCQSYSFPNGDCIDDSTDGDSFRASCSADGSTVRLEIYGSSQRCGGAAQSQTVDANTCYQDEASGAYVQFSC